MNVTINGESTQLPNEISATQLIENLGLIGRRVAMEVNLEIVPRSTFDSFIIKDNDKIEIVHAIGGG